jgi:hypothetical protein
MLLYTSMGGHGKNASFAKKKDNMNKDGYFERLALVFDAFGLP